MSTNGYAPDVELDDLPPGETPGGWIVPGVEYDDGWDMDLTIDPCPDRLWRPGDSLDATLWAGKFSQSRATGHMRLRESKRLRFDSKDAIDKYCEKLLADVGRDRAERLREAWGGGEDLFAFGGDAVPSLIGSSSLTRQFIPLIPGPVTRQLYWQDYFAMSAKAFEAYNHDPLTWRGVQLVEQFALGAGLTAKVTKTTGTGKGQTHDQAQAVWDKFWKANKMDERMKKIARDIEILGEQFIRYFPGPNKTMRVRSLDPASIYDIVTDPEDFETVFYYHQQFQTPYQLYAPQGTRPTGAEAAPTGGTMPGAATRYIIRQIDWREVDHYRINCGGSERRGRSSLYPILGWIKRLRDYMTSRVVQADMHSRYAYDLEVKGSSGDLARVKGQMFPGGKPPPPGSVFGHGQNVALEALSFQQAAQGLSGDATFEALVNLIAVGIGVPKEYLGFQGKGSRAGSLVATEPGAKRFESTQELLRLMLENIAERVFEAAGISDADIEFTFPSIAAEERSQKLQDLAFAEAMGWLSKQSSASMAAKELDVENYEFEQEQSLIAQEFPEAETEPATNPTTGEPYDKPKQGDGKPRRTVIAATLRQAAKLDITKSPSSEDEPPGLMVPLGEEGGSNGGTRESSGPATRGGIPANQNPAASAGANRIKSELRASEPRFTLEDLAFIMREAKGPRRRPDDPEFQKDGQEFREQTARNLGDLVKAASR